MATKIVCDVCGDGDAQKTLRIWIPRNDARQNRGMLALLEPEQQHKLTNIFVDVSITDQRGDKRSANEDLCPRCWAIFLISAANNLMWPGKHLDVKRVSNELIEIKE